MKSIKTLFILIFIAVAAKPALAQQEQMYTQYMFNMLALNPAYAGSRNVTSITALYRDQWVGLAGAPRTGTITMDMPIDDKKIGLGIQVYSDKIGITSTQGAFASYAYRIRFDKGTLSFGVQGGVSQYLLDFNSVSLNSQGFGTDIAFGQNINKLLPDFGTGVYYNSDRFYIGLSSPQLLNNSLTNLAVTGNSTFAGEALHVFFATGYVFPIGTDLGFKPSILIKGTRGSPIEADLNATIWIKDVIAFGAQYRTDASIAALVELQITPQIKLGYSYDASTTTLVQYNTGSHEIMLRYEFGFPKGKILSPRYF